MNFRIPKKSGKYHHPVLSRYRSHLLIMHLNGRLDNSSIVSAWIAKTAKQLLCQTIYDNGLVPESIFIHFIKGKYLICKSFLCIRPKQGATAFEI